MYIYAYINIHIHKGGGGGVGVYFKNLDKEGSHEKIAQK